MFYAGGNFCIRSFAMTEILFPPSLLGGVRGSFLQVLAALPAGAAPATGR